MSEFKIYNKKPLSHKNCKLHRGRKCKYPWDALKVGQSFFVKDKRYRTMYCIARSAAHSRGTKYSIESLDDGVWVTRVL